MATYYVSNTGSDSNDGLSTSTTWQTLAKVSSSTFAPADQILFKKGDTFYGTLTVPSSGSTGNPITFGAYGSGVDPKIEPKDQIPAWTDLGGGKWQASTNATLKYMFVTVDGEPIYKGKNPRTEENYYVVASATSNTVTDSALNGFDYTGGEIVARTSEFTYHVYPITAHSGSTITFTNTGGSSVGAGQKYFIQNLPQLCTNQFDYAYNFSTHAITVNFGGNNPSSYNIAAIGTNEQGISISNKSNIVFQNLNISFGVYYAVYMSGCTNITFNNCTFKGGLLGAYYSGCTGIVFDSCDISKIAMHGIYGNSSNSSVVSNNFIHDICMVDGDDNTSNGNQSGMGVFLFAGNNNYIHHNLVQNVGYVGLRQDDGNYNIIEKNHISLYCQRMQDGGAIYSHDMTWYYIPGSGGYSHRVGNEIRYNIVNNQNSLMRTSIAGIYLDDSTNGYNCHHNIVVGNGVGVVSKTFDDIIWANNLLYDNDKNDIQSNSGRSLDEEYYETAQIKDNYFITKKPDQLFIYYGFGAGLHVDPADDDSVKTFGVVTGNSYIRLTGEDTGIIDCANVTVGPSGPNPVVYHQFYSPLGWANKYEHSVSETYKSIKPRFNITSNGTLQRSFNFTGGLSAGQTGWAQPFSGGNAVITYDASSPLDGGAAKIEFNTPNDLKFSPYSFVHFRMLNFGDSQYQANQLALIKVTCYSSVATEILIKASGEGGINPAEIYEYWDYNFRNLQVGRNDLEIYVKPNFNWGGIAIRLMKQSAAPFWIDNLEVWTGVVATENNPDTYFRYEENPSDTPRVVSLTQTYTNVITGVEHASSVTIPAWSAVVLLLGSAPITTSILNLGTTLINGIKLGSQKVTKLYKGTTLIWNDPGQVAGASTFNFTKTLKPKMRNNDVFELQKQLTVLGYSIKNPNGYFGVQTISAVKAFQTKHKLKADGIVGERTRNILNK